MINAIDPNQLLTQMRAMQAQASDSVKPAALQPGQEQSSDRVDFSKAMQNAVGQVNQLQQSSGDLKTAFEMGDPNVNLVDVMMASQKASVAFEATLQVRNKMVEAYQEVMRMSI